MRVFYRRAARDDVVRQFRYYLVSLDLPEIAVRFRDAVRLTIRSLRHRPLIAPRYDSGNPELRSLRSWPVIGFEAIRIYYLPDEDAIYIVRILHGRRDVRAILESGDDR